MKDGFKIASLLVASVCSFVAIANDAKKCELPPWRTPAVNSINRLEARAIAVPCDVLRCFVK